jgi:4-hydroxy-2-oxoheptanedioate aldolase
MLKDPLGDKMNSDAGIALGAYTNDPDMIELMAHIGFDWVLIDQMFTANDWSKTELLIRTAEAAGITPTVRLQAYPWLGYDNRIARDLARAAGIGAKYVRMSVSNMQEVKECAIVARDWHKKPMHIHPFNSLEEWEAGSKKIADGMCIWPLAETKEVLESYREIMAVPEVKIFTMGTTDGSRMLSKGEKPNWYHPELWKLIDEAVAWGKKTGTVVGSNTSYAYDLTEIKKRILKLSEHGVRVILVQGAPFLFQIAIGQFLRDVKAELPAGS